MRKWWSRGAWALLVLLLALVAGGGLYAWRALPRTSGTLELAGPRAPIAIERDAHGIPAIRAASMADAMFGLGFVHAQDRLWQLETHRRIASGRLAEAFGPGALATDRFIRALGVHRAAEAQWARTTGEARAAILAYTAGINAFLTQALRARPPEFVLLGVQPEAWTPADSLGWLVMMAWDLGANWSGELLRMRLAQRLPVARIDELLPPYPGEQPLPTADYAKLLRDWQVAASLDGTRLAALEQAAPESGIEGVGSNNWVVAGTRTASGKPLLANDPHLHLTAPALWYFARIEAPGLHVAGATLPGLPMVVLGQNGHLAWGFTNTGPDVQDLYLERIKPDDPTQYRTPDGWAPFETATETIKVKGAADVQMTVRRTRHGPVISDAGVADGLTGPADAPTYAIAMRWTALDADIGTLDASLAMNRATSAAGFVAATAGYAAPMQNMVVADRDGHIAEVSAGRVPLRKPENDLHGLVPAPGWDARYDWAGFLDAALTPREIDPPRGWIATANQRITPPDYAYFITSEWTAPWRYERIAQLLEATPQHTLESMAAMQADIRSLATERLLPFLRKAKSSHPLAADAQRALAALADGRMAGERAGPLIFWAWVRQLTEGLFADEIGRPLFERSFGGRTFREALEGVLARDDAWWCDDKTTQAVQESCAMQIDAALTRALDELEAAQGDDVAAWRWDRAHVARSEHRPFSKVRALAPLFELRTPVGGDTFTLDVSRVNLKADPITGERYLDEHGPSLRAIYDLGDPSRSRFMHSSGQSGLFFSPHFRDFVAPWREVEYVPLWGEGGRGEVLTLQPTR